MRHMTYLRGRASAQRAGASAEVTVPVAWRGLQGAHQAVQVIQAPISRQLLQARQRAAEVNVIISSQKSQTGIREGCV